MKKSYATILTLVFGASITLAQNGNQLPTKDANTSKFANHKTESNVVSSRAGGGLNCSIDEGFDAAFPAGWTNEMTNANQNWVYAAAGGNPSGSMYIQYDLAAQDESIILPAQDLSLVTDPGIYFDWLASYYWAIDQGNYDISVSISTDGGTTYTQLWSEEEEGEFDTFEWYSKRLNLSAYASETAAIFKFNYSGADGAEARFDNISICTIPQNDLIVDLVYAGDIVNDYLYTQVPASQGVEVVAGAIVRNWGLAAQTNLSYDWELTLDGNSVATGTAAGEASLASDAVDTLWISTGYTRSTAGELVVSIDVEATETEEIPANNSGESTLVVTEFVWGHDYEDENYIDLGYGSADADWADAQNGFEMGADYFCQVSGSTIYALQFALSNTTTSTSVICNVYEDATTAGPVSQTVYDIQPGDLSGSSVNFITVVLDDPVSMNAGSVYTATVEISAGDDGYILGNSFDDNDGGQSLYLSGPDAWYNWIGLTTSMRLNLDASMGVVENEDVSGVSIYPNPTTDNLNINFVSKDNQNMTINVIGVDGALVFSQSMNAKVGQATKTTVDFANLAKGIYMVQLVGANSSLTQRVVVQ